MSRLKELSRYAAGHAAARCGADRNLRCRRDKRCSESEADWKGHAGGFVIGAGAFRPDRGMTGKARALSEETTEDFIGRVLRAARAHVGMDIGFISELRDGHRMFRFVDAASDACPVEAGGSDPLEESYCHYVGTGRVPELLRDPRQHPLTSGLRVTHELPVGTHLSVPIPFSDGSVPTSWSCTTRSTTPPACTTLASSSATSSWRLHGRSATGRCPP